VGRSTGAPAGGTSGERQEHSHLKAFLEVIIGGSLMMQRYVEDIGRRDHLRLISHSNLFTPTRRTK
jgi:hypothetical protein